MIPVTSHWPPHYIALANQSRTRSTREHSKTISIPLSVLIRDIIAGEIELRDARRYFSRLLISTWTRDGGVDVAVRRAEEATNVRVRVRVRVKLDVDTEFWSEVGWWVLWRGVVGDLGCRFNVSTRFLCGGDHISYLYWAETYAGQVDAFLGGYMRCIYVY